ncbi:MAG: GAF domain-containing protein [Chloroflexia bacterium]
MYPKSEEEAAPELPAETLNFLEVSRGVVSTLELKPLLSRILDHMRLVADYSSCAIAIVRGAEAEIWDARAGSPDATLAIRRTFPVEMFGPIWEAVQRGDAVVLDDARAEGVYENSYRSVLAWLLETTVEDINERMETDLRDIRSWVAVPLMLNERAIGTVTLGYGTPGYYKERHVKLTMAIANQAAIALENARLYEQAREAARSTEALARIASRVAFGGSLESTLDDMCVHIVHATGAVAAGVVLYDDALQSWHMVGSHGHPEGYVEGSNQLLSSRVPLLLQAAYDERKAVMVGDMRRKLLESPESAPIHQFMDKVAWDTIVALPMIYEDKQMGVLLSYHPPGVDIAEREMTFYNAIANQAAVAVENARLLAQVEKRAAQEQRQRLARELHDSVSQALFSINLTARAIETILKREIIPSEMVMGKLHDLGQLTSGAMSEMKALIFELRPGALEEEGLLSALAKHAAAVQARELLSVTVTSRGDLPKLNPAVEEALYRIAQEALHNVVKHAGASTAEIIVEADNARGCVVLRVRDDGAGFDISGVPAGHMGLGTMRQRAESLRGECRVETAPGRGTEIIVSVPVSAPDLGRK